MVKSAATFLKLIVVAGLAVFILIALWFVDSTISDRQNYRDEAVKSISSSYASEQSLLGPMLVQPYRVMVTETTTDAKGVKQTITRPHDDVYSVFPRQLYINGELHPSVRRHGLYRVTVYEFQGTLAGHFDVPEPPIKGHVDYGIPYLAFLVADARGIVGSPVMSVNGTPIAMLGAIKSQMERDSPVQTEITPGTNLRAVVPTLAPSAGSLDFNLQLTLAGTQKLSLTPLADSNRFELTSPWVSPLFAGQFLPRAREINTSGFHAVWEISSLASSAQQQISSRADKVDSVSTTLNETVDPYTLSDRAVKYGILFVLLTFGGFFLFEIVKGLLIHPIQYLLVGFCLAIFFLLLVSLSEHIPFAAAYFTSSVACIGLLTYYLVFVLRSTVLGLGFGAILSSLYAAIYGLLISEDNALLLGSLLLFGVIAIIMIATRKVDWYQRTSGLAAQATMPSPDIPT